MNESNHNKENVVDLASRIKDANKKSDLSHTDENIENDSSNKNSRVGSEFLGSVAGGAILGYGIDWYFNTLPWGFLFFLVMGFVSAVYRANAAMQNEK